MLAGAFGLAAATAGGWSLVSLVEALLAPAMAAIVAFPLALLLLRTGPMTAWTTIVVVLFGATATLFPGAVAFSSGRRRLAFAVILLLGAAVGWASLGRLPGRARLRRLALGTDGARVAAPKVGRRRPPGRKMAVAGLLVADADPRRRIRRLVWLLPLVGAATWATWWARQYSADEFIHGLPFLLALGLAISVVIGRDALPRETEQRTIPGGPWGWGYRIDPLPVSPREVVSAGLSVRVPMLLGALAFGLVAALELSWDLFGQFLAILLVCTVVSFLLQLSVAELRGVSPEREPLRALSRESKIVILGLGLILAALPWALLSGHLQPVVDRTVSGLVILANSPSAEWLGSRLHQLRSFVVRPWLGDIRWLAAAAGSLLVVGSWRSLLAAIRSRENRTSDVWP